MRIMNKSAEASAALFFLFASDFKLRYMLSFIVNMPFFCSIRIYPFSCSIPDQIAIETQI